MNSMTLKQNELEALIAFIVDREIKYVVEIGTGQSTVALDNVCNLTTYDTNPEYIIRYQQQTKNTKYKIWNGKSLILYYAELVFIDGPMGGKNREPSYQAAVKCRTEYIACHDTNRSEDDLWIKKHIEPEYDTIVSINDGCKRQGLKIFQRKVSKDD